MRIAGWGKLCQTLADWDTADSRLCLVICYIRDLDKINIELMERNNNA